jgi:hypothetical protein
MILLSKFLIPHQPAMKKFFLFGLVIIISVSVFCQRDNHSFSELSIGLDGSMPVGKFSSSNGFGFGFDGKFGFNFNGTIAATLQTGYISFAAKSAGKIGSPELIGFVPIKMGLRYRFPESFLYIEPQAGTIISDDNSVGNGFTYAINLGYQGNSRLDLSLFYEAISTEGTLSFAGLRVAFNFY